MSKSAKPKTASLVELSTGVEVPRTFERRHPIGTLGEWSVKLDCTSGAPALVEFTIRARADRPIPADELTLDDVNRFIDYAIKLEAERVKLHQLRGDAPMVASASWVAMFPEVADDAGLVVVDDEILDDAGRQAVQAAHAARKQGGRPPITDTKKIEIYKTYQSAGIDAARDVSGAGERWTRELIRQGKALHNDAKGKG